MGIVLEPKSIYTLFFKAQYRGEIMPDKDNSHFVLIAIVAMVAIVGLIVVFNTRTQTDLTGLPIIRCEAACNIGAGQTYDACIARGSSVLECQVERMNYYQNCVARWCRNGKWPKSTEYG
jgi:hypothetical protein